jgi:hypothetical protein
MGIAVKISSNSYVVCNTVDSTGYGFFFGGVCTGTSFKGNYMRNHYTGLYLNKVAVIGQQPSNGTPPYHGNSWLDTTHYTSGYGAVNMNDSLFFNLQLSLFTTNQNVLPHNPKIPLNNALPPFYVNDQGWFDPQNFGSSFTCSASMVCNAAIIGGGDDETRRIIAEDNEITTEFIPESKWIAKQQLYDELFKDSLLMMSDTLYQVFLLNNESNSIGQLKDVTDKISEWSSPNSTLADSLYAKANLISLYSDSLYVIDSLNYNGLITNYRHKRADLVNKMNYYQLQLKFLIIIQSDSDAFAITLAQQVNEAIITDEQPDENEKIINKATINYYQEGKQGINDIYNNLLSVAAQCPYKGGNAVYRARTLVRLFNDSIEYDDATACLQYGIYRSANLNANKGNKNKIFIKPIPTDEQAEIILNGDYEGICKLNITDALSRMVFSESFDCKARNHSMNLIGFLPGIYQVHVIINNEFFETLKLVIIR